MSCRTSAYTYSSRPISLVFTVKTNDLLKEPNMALTSVETVLSPPADWTVCPDSSEKPWRQNCSRDWLNLNTPASLDIICPVYALPARLPSFHPSIRSCHCGQTLLCAKEMRDELLPTGRSLHESIRFLIFLNCHLLNCSAAALARAQITTFIAEPHLNLECTCKPSVQHSWALRPAVDGRNEKRRAFHLITCTYLTIQLAE